MNLNQISLPSGAVETLDDGIGFVALVDRMQNDPALKVVNAARISYDKKKSAFDDKDKKLCAFSGSTATRRRTATLLHLPLESAAVRVPASVQISGRFGMEEVRDRRSTGQLGSLRRDVRHDKGCSWNEVSGRYVEWTPEFYVPKVMRANPPHGNKQASVDLGSSFDHDTERALMIEECRESFERYKARIQRGVAKEIARLCLPQSVYSQAYWTVSLQGVLHFLEQRLKPDAQFEIRRYAEAVHELVRSDLDRSASRRNDSWPVISAEDRRDRLAHSSAVGALCLLASFVAEDAQRASPPPDLTAAFAAQGIHLDVAKGICTIPASILVREDLLEYVLVNPHGQAHESMFTTDVVPSVLNVALLALGVKPGQNASWVLRDPKPPRPRSRTA
jgi:thymidylate synthase (FAD)